MARTWRTNTPPAGGVQLLVQGLEVDASALESARDEVEDRIDRCSRRAKDMRPRGGDEVLETGTHSSDGIRTLRQEFVIRVGGDLGALSQLRLLATRRRYRREAFRALEPLCWRAPSAYNTQPWRLRCESRAVRVGWDPVDALPAADPTGRDLRLSLGAFVETCLVVPAAGALTYLDRVETAGCRAGRVRLPRMGR